MLRDELMTKPASKKSKPQTSDQMSAIAVADWVRDKIRLGGFVPGQRLVENDIVTSTKSSRSKVREAFQRLEIEGLIEIAEFKGASVKRLSLADVQNIYKTRMALEGLAASELAAKTAPEVKKRLGELQQQMNEWEDKGDHERYAQLNSEWHNLIIQGSGNQYAAQFLSQLTVPIYRLLFSSFYKVRRIQSANADHREITSAILEGRVADAETAMRNHILHGLDALSEINAEFFS